MFSEIHVGKIFYEIAGGRNPEIIKFVVDAYEITPYGILFPNKCEGRAIYENSDLGLIVFEDEPSAIKRLEQIRRFFK